MRSLFSLTVLCMLLLLGASDTALAGDIQTEPEAAKAQDPDFSLQGEYKKEGEGLQVCALGSGKFFVATLKGGLPGEGWDAKTVSFAKVETAALTPLLTGFTRVERKSATEGAKPPAGATVLFDGSNTDEWDAAKTTPDNLLMEGTKTKKKFKNFTLHLEFRVPYKTKAVPSSQDRGNSGVYIFNRYEVQLLDAFALHYLPNTHPEAEWKAKFEKDLGFKPASDRTQWTGAMYKTKTADLSMCYPPLAWQTYDITFTAPKFEGDKKVANARITVIHNGVKVQDDVELQKGTGAGGNKAEVPEESIYLQAHGNPNRFRNVWIAPKN